MTMDIEPRHLAYKKTIGKVNSLPVIEMATTGGLCVIVMPSGGSFETLAMAPHPAIARFMAEKRMPQVEWTELSKSEHVDPKLFEDFIPRYEAITERARKLQGR